MAAKKRTRTVRRTTNNGVRNGRRGAKLTVKHVLSWADAHNKKHKKWPTQNSGSVVGARGENWKAINAALRAGSRGLPGGTTLAQLLHAKRGVVNRLDQSTLTIQQILKWADAHHKRTGEWPTRNSGAVKGAGSENWSAIHEAIRHGRRGMRGGSSLPRLLAKHRSRPYRKRGGRLTIKQILGWAKRHHKRNDRWPTKGSGKVIGTKDEQWGTIDAALKGGFRGMAGGTSLSQLLNKHVRR